MLLAGLGEEWRGFSVTMPCKQAAVEVADASSRCPAAGRGQHPDPHRQGLAGGEHRRHRRRHGAAAGRRGAGRRRGHPRRRGDRGRGGGGARVAGRPARRRRRPEPGPRRRPRPRAGGPGGAGRGSSRSPRTTSTHRWWSARCRSMASPTCWSWAGGPGRRSSTCSTRPWPTPLAQRVTAAGGRVVGRAGGAVLAGHRPGRADDRAAGADRRDARALDAAVGAR